MDNKIEILSMRREHLSEVLRIERATFSDPWREEDFLSGIEDEDKFYFVAMEKGELIGYVGYWAVLDEAQIYNVAVREEDRGKGVGRSLLKTLLCHGRENGKKIFLLEVRESNQPAIRLYDSLGFTKDGLRPGFYRNPVEAALLMSLRFT